MNTEFSLESLRETNQLEDLNADGRILKKRRGGCGLDSLCSGQ
jgi:hypothetical protein